MTPIKYVFVLLALALAEASGAARLQEARPLMGTVVEIIAEGRTEAQLHDAVGAAYREMERLSDVMNHYDPASVVSAINAAAGVKPVATPPELFEVLGMSQRLSERSAGAFDITVGALRGWRFRRDAPRLPPPEEIKAQRARVDYRKLRLDARARSAFLAETGMRIDLGGIAKVYILHAGLHTLERRRVTRAMVNGGGDVLAFGGGWRIGVRDPRSSNTLLGVVELKRGAMLTSGDYERSFMRDGKRYHHILNPHTGYPADGPHGVTLLSEDVEAVNGLGVAIMVRGKDWGVQQVSATPSIDALIVDRDKSVWTSPGFRRRLRAVPTPR